jgi:DNA-binding protein HU-beta
MANKAQLIEALSERLGDKKVAAEAVDGFVDIIVRRVQKGEKVNITGFGVFEKRARAARTARNPRTGETVRVKKTNVPAFRAGTTFKDVISGVKKLPKATVVKRATASTARAAGGTRTATRTAASRPATRSTTTRATTRAASTRTATKTASKPSAKATAKAAPKASKAAAAKKTATRTATKTASKAAPKAAKPAARKATAKKTSAATKR